MMPAVVIIYWVDATTTNGWSDEEEVLPPLPVVTCGMLVSETEDAFTVAATQNAAGQYADAIAIPKGCIAKVLWSGFELAEGRMVEREDYRPEAGLREEATDDGAVLEVQEPSGDE